MNMFLSPLAVIIGLIIFENFGYPLYGVAHYKIKNAVLFFAIYSYSSYFFQPDLDHFANRPGKGYFPIGKKVTIGLERVIVALCSIIVRRRTAISISHTFTALLSLVASTWNYFWSPYASFFTHRGLPHWPVIGTLTRVYWVYLPFMIAKKITGVSFPLIDEVVKSFHVWDTNHLTLTIALPIIIADIMHSAVDFYESLIKGYSFCPPRIPRGILAKALRITL